MKNTILVLLFLVPLKILSQNFEGHIYLKEDANLFINQVYVTNIKTFQTVLTDFKGNFSIPAKEGDLIRFTSIITERKDLKISPEFLKTNKNIVELFPAYHDIPEVVIGYKLTGNLKKDVNALNSKNKGLEIQKMLGLPVAKGGEISPIEPLASTGGGNINISLESIYDYISGDRAKKLRAYNYEKMMTGISKIRSYFGDEYFIKINIPKNLIDNFLQFVYTSDALNYYTQNNNFEPVQNSIQKYLPIYLKRLKNSNLMRNL